MRIAFASSRGRSSRRTGRSRDRRLGGRTHGQSVESTNLGSDTLPRVARPADVSTRLRPAAHLETRPPTRVAETSPEVAFPPLDLIHALAEQIPDKGQHLVRYYGAYSNRARRLHAAEEEGGGPGGREDPREKDSEFAKARRRSWARLLRRILEMDPLSCPQCGAEMRIVSGITDLGAARK